MDHSVRLLDDVQLLVGGVPAALNGSTVRTVLAILAMRPDQRVSQSELIDAVWGEAPPRSARGILYTAISSLRQVLEPDRGARRESKILVGAEGGYRLRLPHAGVDLHRFEASAVSSRRRWAADDKAGSLAAVEAALGEWGGAPLGGAAGPLVDRERARLDLVRLDLLERRCAALLETGAAEAAVTSLAVLVEEHPLRERFHELLIRALFRCGRQSEALDAYRRVRDRLIDEIGIERGEDLRRAHQLVLSGDEPRPVVRLRPAQLPRKTARFAGRAAELRQITRWCAGPDVPDRTGAVVIVDGPPGVGKTALALEAANQLAGDYPDGQIYLDLRGFDPYLPPLTASEALQTLLRSLGAEFHVTAADAAAAGALYRTTLAGRRVLVMLDNAADVSQVRALLPGNGPSAVLVTSRRRLAGLVAAEGAARVTLSVPAPSESLAMLRDLLLGTRSANDADGLREITTLCGHLPLALRIAAQRLLDGEPARVADLVDELQSRRRRLDALRSPGNPLAEVRLVFSSSYDRLQPDEQRAFRLLGLHPTAQISEGAAAELLGSSPEEARRRLAALSRWHLLEADDHDNWGMHDLIRLYARECADAAESRVARRDALGRLMRWYLAAAEHVRHLVTPDLGTAGRSAPTMPGRPETYAEAVRWADHHLPLLAALVPHAAAHGMHRLAARIASTLGSLFHGTSRWAEWLECTEAGRRAAAQAGDLLSQARLTNDAGIASHFLGHGAEAIELHEEALQILRGLPGDDGLVVANIAVASSMIGRHRDALVLLTADAPDGDSFAEAARLLDISAVQVSLGRYPDAIGFAERAAGRFRAMGITHMLGHALLHLSEAGRAAGKLPVATAAAGDALQVWRAKGDRWGEATSLRALAAARRESGREHEAQQLLAAAAKIALHPIAPS